MKIKLTTLKKRIKNGDKIKAYSNLGEYVKIIIQGGNYVLVKNNRAEKYKQVIWGAK